jgi:hypothetical protein
MDEIKTFEDACKKLGILELVPDFSTLPEKYRASIYAHYKLMIIADALNEGWIPDWTNSREYKYYPWFEMGSPSGVGFSCDGYDLWYTLSGVGSRLCFKTAELARYAGKQFEELYKEYFVLSA